MRIYPAPAWLCNARPLEARCTASFQGQQLKRNVDEANLVQVRGSHATEQSKKAVRKQHVWVESLFAEAKDWHALHQFRLRGLTNANIQGRPTAAR